MAAYRLAPGLHREPVIAEIRIFPREGTRGRPPGRWSAEVLGLDAKIPEGGLSAEVIRQVRIGEHRQVGAAFSRWLQVQESDGGPIAARFAALTAGRTLTVQLPSESTSSKRGRPPIRDEKFYAKLAEDYAERVARGSPRPTADVARRRKLPAAKVRDMLHEARRRGFLSSAGRGRRGGQVTSRALDLLKAD